MKRRSFIAGLATTAVVAAVSACGSSSSTTSASSAPAAAAAVKGGTLNILMSTQTEHWDPQRVYVGVNIEAGNRLFTRTLVTWSATASDTEVAKIVPDLATDTGKVSEDGKTWTFTLKDGVKWQDGKDITGDDVKYGISRTFAVDVITGGPNYAIAFLDIPSDADGSSSYKGPYAKTGQALYDKAVTVSGKTITFKLKTPVMDFNNTVTMTAFAPFRADKDLGDKSNYDIFSSGPYKLEGVWTAEKGGSFVRNESWDPATDTVRKAYPDKITWDESLKAETMYERLIADQANDQTAITFDQAPVTVLSTVESGAKGRFSIVASPYTRYLTPNFKSKVMSNPKVREAFALATDRSAYVTAVGGSSVAVATNSLINPALPAFPNTPLPAGEKGDQAKAKTMLQDAGLTLPVKITVAYRKSDTADKVFAGLKTAWDAAGFDVQLDGFSAKYYATIQSPEAATKYDAMWAGWGADYPSASTVIPPLLDSRINITSGGSGQDYGWFDDKDINAKMDATNKIADMAAREKAWGDLDTEIVTKKFGIIPLIVDKFVFVRGSKVVGAFVNGAYTGYYDPATISIKAS
jgi:peptide/nickel transport system substrate-binding protein